jgi:hypothetical protein
MQNRRGNGIDKKVMFEPLDETVDHKKEGLGISVPATYYV